VSKSNNMYIPTYDDVLAAHERIKPHIHQTPVLTSTYFNDLTGAELFFKCENFQKAGVFKARGASNAVFGLDDDQAAKGVATHSSGNHGLSLSYAAGKRGIKATVVMPRTAPAAKKDAVRGYGATVVECEPSTSSREAVFGEVVARSGADFIHPYNDPRVIAGQGTCAKELVERAGALDAVIAPIGGGGTGSYYFEGTSGVFNELQCGSYAFMDADYGRILDKDGKRIDQGEWENSLFILTSVMSHTKTDKAIVDAGLKAQSVDSGLPTVFGRDDKVEYLKCSDEHGVVGDPDGALKVNDKLRLVPGHCDPTCNVHDWYVGVRGGKVECVWPVSARGKAY